jgi:cytoskeletal protein CcmA (bactofilin family)
MTYLQKLSTAFAFILALFIVGPTAANASTVVRTGDAVSIAEEQAIEGDFYSVAGKINISGEIKEDMVAAAGEITINGAVDSNAFLVAGRAEIHGTIGDDLRIISGNTTIADPVMGDVLVIGGSVDILSTASVAGDVLIFAGNVVIEGSVGGDILGTVGTLRIDAPVAGDVDVTTTQLTLGDRANIAGSVRYVSEELVVRSPNATITGDMVRNDPVLPGSQQNIQSALIPMLVLLFSILVWYLVSRKSLEAVVGRSLTKSPRPVLLGLATILFTPVAFVLLFLSMIGTLISFVLLLGYLLFIVLGIIGVSAVLGQLLVNVFNRPGKHVTLLSIFVGVISVTVLMLFPFIGQVALLILVIVTLGSIVDLLLRPNKEEQK